MIVVPGAFRDTMQQGGRKVGSLRRTVVDASEDVDRTPDADGAEAARPPADARS